MRKKKILIVGCNFTGLAIHNSKLLNTDICKLEKETHNMKSKKDRIIDLDLDYVNKHNKKLNENKHPFEKFIGRKKR